MNNWARYFLFGLLFLVLSMGGFFMGQSFVKTSSDTDKQITEETQISENTNSDYLAANLSSGPLIQTQEIHVTFSEDSATGSLKLEDPEKIKTGQAVILYDKDGIVMPLGGVISKVQEESNNELLIKIDLPAGTNTDFLLTEPEIITLETNGSRRIPLSALQTEENGNSYIWIARADIEKKAYTVTRQYIEKGLSGNNFFDPGYDIDTYALIILNPDKNIRSNRKYNIEIVELNAPLHNPTRQAWIDYDLYRLEKEQEELLKIAADCDKGLPPAPVSGDQSPLKGDENGNCGDTTNSCGDSANDRTNPLAVFNALQKQSEGVGACSSSPSCGDHPHPHPE